MAIAPRSPWPPALDILIGWHLCERLLARPRHCTRGLDCRLHSSLQQELPVARLVPRSFNPNFHNRSDRALPAAPLCVSRTICIAAMNMCLPSLDQAWSVQPPSSSLAASNAASAVSYPHSLSSQLHVPMPLRMLSPVPFTITARSLSSVDAVNRQGARCNQEHNNLCHSMSL